MSPVQQLPPVIQVDIHFQVSYETYGICTVYLYGIYYEHMTDCTHEPGLSRCAWDSGMATPTRRTAADGSSVLHEQVNRSQVTGHVQNQRYL